MDFVKTMMFLGVKRRAGNNGITYVVDLFCPNGDSWQFYVRDGVENNDLVTYLMRCSSGVMVDVGFHAGKTKDGNTYLRMTSICDAA